MPGRKFRPNLTAGSRPGTTPSRPAVPTPPIDQSDKSKTETTATTQQINPDNQDEQVTSLVPLSHEGRARCHDDTVVNSSLGKTSWVRKRVAPKLPPAGKSRKRPRPDQQKDDETISSDVGVAPVDSCSETVSIGVVNDVPMGVVNDVSVANDVPVGVVNDVPAVLQPSEPMPLEVASNVEITVAMPINDINESDCTSNDIHEDTTDTNDIHETITAVNDIHEEAEVVPDDERSVRSESVCSSVSREEEDTPRCKRKKGTSSVETTPSKRRKKKSSPGAKGKSNQFREAPDRSKMTMQDLIYYNPSANPMSSSDKGKGASGKSTQDTESNDEQKNVVDAASPKSEEDGRLVPQLKIDVDGNIIIDEKSMVVESSRSDRIDLDNVVTEDGSYTTSTSFRDKHKIKKWTKQETSDFYKALTQVGTDFTMMTLLLPKRSRKELKNKFKKEEKNNSTRVSNALCKLCTPTSSATTTTIAS